MKTVILRENRHPVAGGAAAGAIGVPEGQLTAGGDCGPLEAAVPGVALDRAFAEGERRPLLLSGSVTDTLGPFSLPFGTQRP